MLNAESMSPRVESKKKIMLAFQQSTESVLSVGTDLVRMMNDVVVQGSLRRAGEAPAYLGRYLGTYCVKYCNVKQTFVPEASAAAGQQKWNILGIKGCTRDKE